MEGDISKYIPVYIGKNITPIPMLDWDRVDFTEPDIRIKIDEIMKHLEKLEPDWSNHTINTASIWFKDEITRSFPYLNDEAIDSLVWLKAYLWWHDGTA